jgi:plasmid replication initiation protein
MLEKDNKPLMVYQDNQLIEASYHLTLNEKRLVLLAITKIDRSRKPKEESPNRFVITVAEWAAAYQLHDPYRELKRAVADLFERAIHIRGGGIKRGRFRWITSEIEYEDSSVCITFTHDVSLYLQGFVDCFTKYDLLHIKSLTSTYSIRLYELIKQWANTSTWRIDSLDDLRYLLNTEDAYPKWSDFNRYVIKKAVQELNDKTNLTVTYKPAKRGRDVSAVRFEFKENQQADLFKS